MGITNITATLERQIARYLGERIDKQRQIERIEKVVDSLPELRERVQRLTGLIAAAELVIREQQPDWSIEKVRPLRRHQHAGAIPNGKGAPMALDVLRTSDGPRTTREIALEMLASVGEIAPDKDEVERVQRNVEAAFHVREDKIVEGDGGWPQRWRLIRPSDELNGFSE